MPCPYDLTSQDLLDFIVTNNINLSDMSEAGNIVCLESIDDLFSVLHTFQPMDISLNPLSHTAIPNLYTLLDTTSMSSSGILQILEQPFLDVRGQGTLIGFIDTGIDYRNPLFQSYENTTRILGIWDQTLYSETNDTVPYGTEFTQEQINEALSSENPLSIVPSMDEDGHGTFVAGIAAGNESLERDFIGAAPDSNIAVVKLKPAKQYLRDFFCVQNSAICYQENDIMQGIRYLHNLAASHGMPLVVYIGVGTNYGSHEGTSPLCITLRRFNQLVGATTVLPAGNETGMRHHYRGDFMENILFEDVEIQVGNGENGFVAQLWANSSEVYSVGFISPLGQEIQRIPINYQTGRTVRFIMESTEITVYYGISEYGSGSHYVIMRFKSPTPGIWRVRVYNTLHISGTYHIWLPNEGFISNRTIFLNPNPDTTVTEPGNTYATITAGTYNHYNGSLYIHSSRGYSRDNAVKPEIVAPGVNVYGPGLPLGSDSLIFPMVRQTGSSIAAAHVAGAVANLMTWGIVNQNQQNMTTAVIKSMLIRGAGRNRPYLFPNRQWGYGTLNLHQTFLRLMD